VAKQKVRDFVKHMNKEKKITMIFTTHDMGDIEKTCDRMLIIDKGKIIYDGTADDIKEKYAKYRTLVVDFVEKQTGIKIPGVEVYEDKGNKIKFRFNKDEVSAQELISSLTQKYGISDFTIQETEVESIIREIYEGRIKCDESLYGVC
jgi:ABC-2 type transport system ATP-binding protein